MPTCPRCNGSGVGDDGVHNCRPCRGSGLVEVGQVVSLVPVLKVYTNDVEHIIGEDLDDVREVLVDLYGDDNDFDADDWREVDRESSLTVDFHEDAPERGKETKTVREWIVEMGRGLLCSTEY